MENFNEVYSGKSNYFGDSPSDGLVAMFDDYIVPRGKALDIGAGEGRNSFFLDRIGYKVTSIEPDKFGADKISKHEDIKVVNSGVLEYSTQEKFDFILAGTSLDQLNANEVKPAADKIIEMLAPGGYSYVLVFTEDDPESSECAGTIGHYFKLGELREIFTHEDIEILFYDEYMKIDTSHGPEHYHGKAKIILRKKATQF